MIAGCVPVFFFSVPDTYLDFDLNCLKDQKGTVMDIVIYIVVAIVCLAVGFLVSRVMFRNSANSAISVAEAKVADAKREAETIKTRSRDRGKRRGAEDQAEG